ncbi:unnamed protein product [Effrenium voratum]|nr:unnamed protein product [Effrenium voratum]
MRWLWLLLLPSALGNVKLGKHIVKYTEEKLRHLLGQTERVPVLLEIFSPSCPACRAFAPRMAQAAARIKEEAPEVKVVALDGTEAEDTMRALGAKEFPALFFIGKNNKTARLDFQAADSAEAIWRWAARLAAPAVRSAEAAEAAAAVKPSGLPRLVLRAPKMIPAFESFAEEYRLKYEALWVQEQRPDAVSVVQHPGAEVSFAWKDAGADSLDEDGERFEEFLKAHALPAVLLVTDPKRSLKALEAQEDAILLWLVVNSSQDASCAESSCSAAKAPLPSAEAEEALQRAAAFAQPLLGEVVRRQKEVGKKALALAVDAARWPQFAEQELYVLDVPGKAALVAQRFRHGPRYFFSENGTLPASAEELMAWLKGLVTRTPRQMSERPAESGKLWKKLVNAGLEEQLRAEPATLLYSFKSPGQLSTEEEVIDFEDEMEALDTLAEWLNASCDRPPVLAALDVRKNEVPLSLYAAASIGSLNAPSLYFIESDAGKPAVGVRWSGEVSEFGAERSEPGSRQRGVLAGKLREVIPWVLARAQSVKGLRVPSSPDLSAVPGAAVGAAVLEVGSEAELQDLLRRNVSGFVEFFSPSCGSCKRLAPVYESAARKAGDGFTFAKVDCSTSQGEKCCAKHNIEAYPSIFYIRGGTMQKYPGGPKRDDLLEFLAMQTEPLAQEVANEEEARKLAAARKKPVLLWRASSPGEAVPRVAREWLRQVKLARLSADRESLALVWPSASIEYEGKISEEEVGLWLAEQLVKSEPAPASQTSPVLTAVGSNFRQVVFDPLDRNQHVILEVYAPWCGHCKQLAPVYEAFAARMGEEGRNLVVAKLNGEANGIPYGGFEYSGFPTIFYLGPGSEKVSKVQERTLEGLVSFADRMGVARAGEAKAKASQEELLSRFRSEEVPVSSSGPILTVVLKNFLSVVFHDTKSCLLMLYAKGCPHCQRMMPEFEALAREVAPEIFLARMDGEANELPVQGFQVKGFPTLFFVEAGSKEPSATEIGDTAVRKIRALLESKGSSACS